ncbi:DNA gyrase subunit A [Candidatus Berkiella cookevillensis]|uniref:DNA gyrase subunit A n=1 Tax=Candidatus Berkiella cookevillensis TaxID=437022 RepID=A0AAE3L4V7_9GAMM|nr:DNA gyrase subunit A [Candidatus Berkiella cookevillensis]MCS5709051.1 DNA gyrase subunit A [Candidatus Berkiella cookevillensis]
MTELAKEIHSVNIEDELKQSYLDYAMSVIVGRALPDVRDGLKPVHRRVLFAMSELGNDWNKAYKKSARVVGDVIGKYHPHGDSAVYDTIVRMAQPFSMRYLLVDGQGNFGSVDGDSAAAMRYTEVRMSKFAHALLADLEKETVNFSPNYDETEFAPDVLPTKVPNLLVNGASGIAVGMATNIPPHNLKEIIDGCFALIDNPEITIDELIKYIPGPDFPTGAIINGCGGIIDAYRTGRGRVFIRAKTEIEIDDKNQRQSIIVNEIPYQVNKARLIEKIAELVKEKKLEGISGLRDESDKDGMRIVVELKRGENADVILNNLFSHTQLETVFGVNMVALVNGQPRTLNLKQILEEFIKHRKVVVNRRTAFDLKKARERAHLLEGLSVALANLDEVIQLIKESQSPQIAKDKLLDKVWAPGMVTELLKRSGDTHLSRPELLPDDYGMVEHGYRLSMQQAQAILDLRLHRLTGLEQDKIFKEYEEIIEEIKKLVEILVNPKRLLEVVRTELQEAQKDFQDERRSVILQSKTDLSREDLIPEETRVVTLSHFGYVKTQPLDSYVAQRRGGRGKAAATVRDEDFIEKLLIANTHDTILCFSDKGKVYWLKVYDLPLGNRQSKGKPIVNFLPLTTDEKISAILPIKEFAEGSYVFMATRMGTVKKVDLLDFSRPRASGIIAVDLEEEDSLVGAELTDGARDVMLFTNAGKAVRFHEDTVRAMGRLAKGVRGIRLQEAQRVVSMIVLGEYQSLLIATENGFGKRTLVEEFPVKGRGGQGVISIQTTERNGQVVGARGIRDKDEAMLISDGGILVRLRTDEISLVGRNTQGVTLINLGEGEKLIGLERVEEIAGVPELLDDELSEEQDVSEVLDVSNDSESSQEEDTQGREDLASDPEDVEE